MKELSLLILLEYLNFGYKTVAAKTGRDIAAMHQMLSDHDGLLGGLENFITDRCPSQELANRLVCEIINSNRPQDAQVNKIIFFMPLLKLRSIACHG